MIRSNTEADSEGAACRCASEYDHAAMMARVEDSFRLDRMRYDLRLANTAWLMRRGAENSEGLAR